MCSMVMRVDVCRDGTSSRFVYWKDSRNVSKSVNKGGGVLCFCY